MRKTQVTMTVTVDVTYDPAKYVDAEIADQTYTFMYRAIDDKMRTHPVSASNGEGIRRLFNFDRIDNVRIEGVSYSGTIPRGNGRSIVPMPALALDSMLETLNRDRTIGDKEWEETAKDFAHLGLVRNSWGNWMMPWISRNQMISVWREFVDQEFSQRGHAQYRLLRKLLLEHMNDLFEDGVEAKDDVEPF